MNNTMAHTPVYISHPTFVFETIRNVSDLLSGTNLEKSKVDDLLAQGVKRYCTTTMSLVEMCARAARDCVTNSQIPALQIDAVIVATTNSMNEDQEFTLMNTLYELGIRASEIVCIQWLHCSAFSQAVEISEMMIRCQRKENVLVILGSKVESDDDRIVPTLGTVMGDGSAAFIVSVRSPGLRLVATKTQRDLQVRLPSSAFADPVRGAKAYTALRSMTRSVLNGSNLTVNDIDAVFCTSGSQVYLELAASAAGVHDDKVYSYPFEQYGHVFSCDIVLGIESYINMHRHVGRQYLLALGWSPHITGATLLEWV